jgi:hypothetical protein
LRSFALKKFFCAMAFEFTAADEQIKELVRSCTSDTLIQPDWAIIMDICDRLNLTPALCSAVSSAVLSRLQNRNPDVGILALHVNTQINFLCN